MAEGTIRKLSDTVSIDLAKEMLGKDGMWHCRKCGEVTARRIRMQTIPGARRERWIRCRCACDEEKARKAQEEAVSREKKAKVEEIRKRSMMGERYEDARFSTVTEDVRSESFIRTLEVLQDYSENVLKMLERGTGIYLYGPTGVGKTYLLAALANELMECMHTVLFTSIAEILKRIRSTWQKDAKEDEEAIFAEIRTVEFLFLDDIGQENFGISGSDNWTREKTYELVNARYNSMRPTIFSSNMSLEELRAKGIGQPVAERIAEMTTIRFELTGVNRRRRRNAV